ncbi:hypothetical protein CEXT_397501 [Caerostris extrusa]|uniref:Uncharacterized protein n=1 Tax=Caerostris extrusa TaxID=172846 RepID=A0AAV4Q4A2_CAEEX|nr:hypothetical protein CEXT_397501 [Caerostris extrusa]
MLSAIKTSWKQSSCKEHFPLRAKKIIIIPRPRLKNSGNLYKFRGREKSSHDWSPTTSFPPAHNHYSPHVALSIRMNL